MSSYFLSDIGGTNARFGISRDGKNVEEVRIFQTPKKFEDGLDLIEKATRGIKFDAVAGGIAGSLSFDKSQVFKAPNLPDLEGKPLKQELQKITGSKVYLENDAAMAALGEAAFGAGKDFEIVAFVTLGTGVGGARIVNRKIDENALGFEVGHQIIDKGSMRDLESFIGGYSIEKKYGKKPFDIEDEKIWDEIARDLAIGINNVIVHWSPNVVILGGSISQKIQIEKVENHLKEILKIYPSIPPIKKSALGNLAGLYGALHYISLCNVDAL